MGAYTAALVVGGHRRPRRGRPRHRRDRLAPGARPAGAAAGRRRAAAAPHAARGPADGAGREPRERAARAPAQPGGAARDGGRRRHVLRLRRHLQLHRLPPRGAAVRLRPDGRQPALRACGCSARPARTRASSPTASAGARWRPERPPSREPASRSRCWTGCPPSSSGSGSITLAMFTAVPAAQLGLSAAAEADRGIASALYFTAYYVAGGAGVVPARAGVGGGWLAAGRGDRRRAGRRGAAGRDPAAAGARAIRLTGLPSARTHPRVTLFTGEDGLALIFAGPAGERRLDVPWAYLEGDRETIELRLLADLQQRGFEVGAQALIIPCGSSTNFLRRALVEVLVALRGLVEGDHRRVDGLGDLDLVVEDRLHQAAVVAHHRALAGRERVRLRPAEADADARASPPWRRRRPRPGRR